MMKNKSIKMLVNASLVAALYTALTVALAPISYGNVQLRMAEALTLLPVFGISPIYGLTVGCAISNAIGVSIGVNTPVDIIFGTLATLIASVGTYFFRMIKLKGIPVISALCPVILNALIIGAELSIVATNSFNIEVFRVYALSIAVGEMLACFVLGVPLVIIMKKTGLGEKLA